MAGYIVKREIQDNGPMGSVYGYKKVAKPSVGETIYHGQFTRQVSYGGQYDRDEIVTYAPVDPSKVTESTYAGEPGEVETF